MEADLGWFGSGFRDKPSAVHAEESTYSKPYCRVQQVGIWSWDDLGWFSFFSRLWGKQLPLSSLRRIAGIY